MIYLFILLVGSSLLSATASSEQPRPRSLQLLLPDVSSYNGEPVSRPRSSLAWYPNDYEEYIIRGLHKQNSRQQEKIDLLTKELALANYRLLATHSQFFGKQYEQAIAVVKDDKEKIEGEKIGLQHQLQAAGEEQKQREELLRSSLQELEEENQELYRHNRQLLADREQEKAAASREQMEQLRHQVAHALALLDEAGQEQLKAHQLLDEQTAAVEQAERLLSDRRKVVEQKLQAISRRGVIEERRQGHLFLKKEALARHLKDELDLLIKLQENLQATRLQLEKFGIQ